MKPWRNLGRALTTGTVTVLIIVLAPAVLLFGELVNRHYLRGLPGRERIKVRRRRLSRRSRACHRLPLAVLLRRPVLGVLGGYGRGIRAR